MRIVTLQITARYAYWCDLCAAANVLAQSWVGEIWSERGPVRSDMVQVWMNKQAEKAHSDLETEFLSSALRTPSAVYYKMYMNSSV